MLVRKVYSEVIFYVLIPLFVVICLFGVVMFILSRVKANETDRNKIYLANFWSAVIGIIFGSILQSVALGFSIAFIQKIHLWDLADIYQVFLVLLYIFPFIPFAFLVYAIYKFVKIIREKTKDDKLQESNEDYEEQII